MPPSLARLLAVAAFALPAAAPAQNTQPYDGFLCCSLLASSRDWISDLSYDDGYAKIIPAGTPVKFKSFGRWRMYVEIGGKEYGLGNDYSRTIDMDTFAKMYVPKEDPRPKIESWPPHVREAVAKRKILRGMTREQVIAAHGYPTTSYNADPKAPLWNYSHSLGQYQVFWTEDGRVDQLFGPAEVRKKVAGD
ncbi:MAG: hypothetical protein KIT17_27235 [Rubrivivax sp.]|nr:hypothetical protein [Rubrivivax sp.]